MRFHKRHILLVIDNCPAHPVVPNLTNMEIVHLPPNTTSHTQSCDQGIIQDIKHKYRTRLLKKFIKASEEGVVFKTNALDTMLFLKQAWAEVSLSTIVNCFAHCGFQCPAADDSIEETSSENCLDPVDEEFMEQLSAMLPNDAAEETMDEHLNMDADLETTSALTDGQIADIVRQGPEDDDEDDDDIDNTTIHIQKPSFREVQQAVDTLRNYFSFSERATSLPHLVAIEKEIKQDAKELENCKVQTTLTNFFSHSPA